MVGNIEVDFPPHIPHYVAGSLDGHHTNSVTTNDSEITTLGSHMDSFPVQSSSSARDGVLGVVSGSEMVWNKHTDESGDVWYSSPSGQTAWQPPEGVLVVDYVHKKK